VGGEVEVLHSAGDGQLIFEQRDFAVGAWWQARMMVTGAWWKRVVSFARFSGRC
jgi:hypothetical protein